MTENSYRIRTNVGDEPSVINLKLNQTFNTLEILSLKLSQEDTYKLYKSEYGVIVGRVLANGGVGVPNAKVSVFIPADEEQKGIEKILYPYKNLTDKNIDNKRYNLLPDSIDDNCHQNVGSFPNKRLMLDNNDVLEVFDKYYKYTTSTNNSGDYMLTNIPTGAQQIHVELDLSDIGFLSQRPRDMVYKYPINLFESPNKFKQDTNLDNLSQIIAQNKGVYVFPFWGDTSEDDNIAITRCDIQVDYKFNPSCVFMGSTIGDNDGYIGSNCQPNSLSGRMSNLITSKGKIEMIRKTNDGNVEEFVVNGNRLIDENGVFCYQIPMNLDYITTDEFGNIVSTDDPTRGIATRASVRFRVTLDDEIGNVSKMKRCSYLIPNNPRLNDDYVDFSETKKVDYEFGSLTKDENFRDLFWNKVYTVKNFIPRLQNDDSHKTHSFSGIKKINHGGDKNRFPYNGLTIKLSFQYTLLCFVTKFIIYLVAFINNVMSVLGALPCWLADVLDFKVVGIRPLHWAAKEVRKFIPKCIKLGSDFCDDGQNKVVFYPGCLGCVWNHNQDKFKQTQEYKDGYRVSNKPETVFNLTGLAGGEDGISLMTCVENALIQENECTSYNFYNDWVNGVLFFPKWHRHIKAKKSYFFGLFKKKAKDEWCSSNNNCETIYLQHCAVSKKPHPKECGNNCESSIESVDIKKGFILPKETMFGHTVYYYKAADYMEEIEDVLLLFATDIVLLGSLNENDLDGVPQFFKNLPITTYQLPNDILDVDQYIKKTSFHEDGSVTISIGSNIEATGQDWGNTHSDICGNSKDGDSGLFYGVGCSSVDMKVKSCINLRRICELGVSLDETQYLPINSMTIDDVESDYRRLIPDGFISWDELYDYDSRAMFATMNHNKLKTEYNPQTGYKQYNFTYLYPINFDGALKTSMTERQKTCDKTYKTNYQLEEESIDYTIFRMGDKPFYYDGAKMPRYENSFYFYFGLKPGATALEKFNEQYFSDCENIKPIPKTPIYSFIGNEWCQDRIDVDENGELIEDELNRRDGYLKLDLSKLTAPYSIQFTNTDRIDLSDLILNDIEDEKVYIGNSTEYLLEKGIIDTISAKKRKEELKGYERLTQDDYDDIVFDSNDETSLAHKNTYLYNNCTLCNGNWHLTITDGEGIVTEIDVPFYREKINCNVISDSFRISEKELYNDTFIRDESRFNPPYSYSEWDKLVDTSELTFNQNTNRKEREIGGLIIIKDVYLENIKLGKENLYVVIESVNNILNEKYQLTDDEGNVKKYEPGSDGNYYYTENNALCDKDGYVYKLGKDGKKCRPDKIYNNNNEEIQEWPTDTSEISKIINNTTIMGDSYYYFNNLKCDKQGYLYDIKVDSNYGNKKFIVDNDDIIKDDFGYNGDDENNGTFYFGVPLGDQEYKVEVRYICSRDYNKDGQGDVTDNIYSGIIKVNEYSPMKLYINSVIDYDIIKNFKSGWDINDTRTYISTLHNKANTKKIVGWNQITDIAVPTTFTKENIKYLTWGDIKKYITFLTQSIEGKDYCPYVWPKDYIYNMAAFNELLKIIEQYNIIGSPYDIIDYNVDNFIDKNSISISENGYVYAIGDGDVYTFTIGTNNIKEFVDLGLFSFYRRKINEKVELVTEEVECYEMTDQNATFKIYCNESGGLQIDEQTRYKLSCIYNSNEQTLPFEEHDGTYYYYFKSHKIKYIEDGEKETDLTLQLIHNKNSLNIKDIKIYCDKDGYVLPKVEINTPNDLLQIKINGDKIEVIGGNFNIENYINEDNVNGNYYFEINNVYFFINEDFYSSYTALYKTSNGEPYPLSNVEIYSDGLIFDSEYSCIDANGKIYPCNRLGYIIAVEYDDEIMNIQSEKILNLESGIFSSDMNFYTIKLTTENKDYISEKILSNSSGFVYSQREGADNYIEKDADAPGGWYITRHRDLYNLCESIDNDELNEVIYDTYGKYINDKINGTTYIETFNDYEGGNGNLLGFKYATEKNGKMRRFKRVPSSNILTRDENGKDVGLIYMYNPSIKNIYVENPTKYNKGWLCDKDGYVYETDANRNVIIEEYLYDEEKSIFNETQYKYDYIPIYYIKKDNKNYLLETNPLTKDAISTPIELEQNILCDKDGYIYAVTFDSDEQVFKKRKITNPISSGDGNYYVYENNSIPCDEEGYLYATLNGSKYKINNKEHNSEHYLGITYSFIEIQIDNEITKYYLRKIGIDGNPYILEEISNDATNQIRGVYYIKQYIPCDENGYVFTTNEKGEKYELVDEQNGYVNVYNDIIFTDSKKNVYATNENGEKYQLKDDSGNVIDFIKGSDVNYYSIKDIKNNEYKIYCDTEGFIYTTDTTNNLLPFNDYCKKNENTYKVRYFIDDNGNVYDNKDCYKYILPYQILEHEQNYYLSNNEEICDKDGYVYAVKNGERIKNTDTDTSLPIYYIEYRKNSSNNDKNGYYYSIGGLIKLYCDGDDAQILGIDNKGQGYTLLYNGLPIYYVEKDFIINNNNSTTRNVYDFIHDYNGYDENSYNDYVYLDDGKISEEGYDGYNYYLDDNDSSTKARIGITYITELDENGNTKTYYINDLNTNKVYCDENGYVLNTDYTGNSYKLYYSLRLSDDETKYVKHEKIGDTLDIKQTKNKDIWYYEIDQYIVYCDKEGFVSNVDDNGNKYKLHRRIQISEEKFYIINNQKILGNSDGTINVNNTNVSIDTDNIKHYTVTQYDYIINNKWCDKFGYIYELNEKNEKIKVTSEIKPNIDNIYYYIDANNNYIYCDKDGFVYNGQTVNKSFTEDGKYYKTIYCDNEGYVYSFNYGGNNFLTDEATNKYKLLEFKDNLPLSNVNTVNLYQHTYSTIKNNGGNILILSSEIYCNEKGQVFLYNKNGQILVKSLQYSINSDGNKYKLFDINRNRINVDNLNESSNNVYYHYDLENMKIYCDNKGYIIQKDLENGGVVSFNEELNSKVRNFYIVDKNGNNNQYFYYPVSGFIQIYCTNKGNVNGNKPMASDESLAYKIEGYEEFIRTENKNITNYNDLIHYYLIKDINGNEYKIYCDKDGYVKAKNSDSKNYKLYTKSGELLTIHKNVNGTNKYAYKIEYTKGDFLDVYCHYVEDNAFDGNVLSEGSDGKPYKLEGFDYVSVKNDWIPYYYYDFGNEKVYCDKEGYVLGTNNENKTYSLKGDYFYSDANGKIYYIEKNSENIINGEGGYYFYDLSIDKLYLNWNQVQNCYEISDKKASLINGNLIEDKYKLKTIDIIAITDYYVYFDATICDKNGIIIENITFNTNQLTNNIILLDNNGDYQYRLPQNIQTIAPCDKEGFLYEIDDLGNKVKYDGDKNYKYDSYYEVNIECDAEGYVFEKDSNNERIELTDGEPTDENGIYTNKVYCDDYGYVYDTYDFNDGNGKVKYGLTNNSGKKEYSNNPVPYDPSNPSNGLIVKNDVFYYYKYFYTPCDENGYVYAVNEKGEKYQLKDEKGIVKEFKQQDGNYYLIKTPYFKENDRYYAYAVNDNGEKYKLVKEYNKDEYGNYYYNNEPIPCDGEGYLYKIDNDRKIYRFEDKIDSIKYDFNKQTYHYNYSVNYTDDYKVSIPCDREGYVYEINENGEKYKLVKERQYSPYNIRTEYKYKASTDQKRYKMFERLNYSNNYEDVYKFTMYDDGNEIKYHLCNKDGFLIVENKLDGYDINGNDKDGYEYSNSTKCDSDGYVYYSINNDPTNLDELYEFFNEISDNFNEILEDVNFYIKKRLDFVKKMQEIFWVTNIDNEPKLLMLACKTDFTPVEFKIGYIKEEVTTLYNEDETIQEDTTIIQSRIYTFGNMNKLDVYLPTYTFNKDNEIQFYQKNDYYKAPYIIGVRNSIDQTLPFIDTKHYKIETPTRIGKDLFHLHFIDKPFIVKFTCLAALVDYPSIPDITSEFYSGLDKFNLDGILYDCKIENGSIIHNTFDKYQFAFNKQMLNNADLEIIYKPANIETGERGSYDEDKKVERIVKSYTNDWDSEGVMAQQSQEIKTETLAEYVCKPYIDKKHNPLLLPPIQCQLYIRDNFNTIDENIYSGMSITLLGEEIEEVKDEETEEVTNKTYIKYRVNNGDGFEKVRYINASDFFRTPSSGKSNISFYDEKYELAKYVDMIDIEDLWENHTLYTLVDLQKYRYEGEDGKILKTNEYTFRPPSENGDDTILMIARTQNNCYAISKPFSRTKNLGHLLEIPLRLEIVLHEQLYISSYINKYNICYSEEDVKKFETNLPQQLYIYYYSSYNRFVNCDLNYFKLYFILQEGYSPTDLIKMHKYNDESEVIYVSVGELMNYCENYSYHYNAAKIEYETETPSHKYTRSFYIHCNGSIFQTEVPYKTETKDKPIDGDDNTIRVDYYYTDVYDSYFENDKNGTKLYIEKYDETLYLLINVDKRFVQVNSKIGERTNNNTHDVV